MDSEFVKPDKEFEKPLRPLTFSDFSGQEKIIEQRVEIDSYLQQIKEVKDKSHHGG